MSRQTNHNELRRNHWWVRTRSEPVFALGPAGAFDETSTMNANLVVRGGEVWMYYAGGDAAGRRRICLAVAPLDRMGDPDAWARRGVVLDVGRPGSFDARWTVLPQVVEIVPGRWHLYYSANSGVGKGLSSFPGIGVAVSDDGVHFEKHGGGPVLAPSGVEGDVDAVGMGGGSVIQARLPDGGTQWRYYYTACPTVGDYVFLDQQKVCALAVSDDGLAWEKRGGVMYRNPDHDYENIAVATPVVQQEADGSYRMWYSAIGTRWGYYSICYAESDDGLTWRRGEHYGDNLQMGPAGGGFQSQMVEYPAVVRQRDGNLRLIYSANGYGSTGTGTAVASPLRACGRDGHCHLRVAAERAEGGWDLCFPEGLASAQGMFKTRDYPNVDWHGPLADGTIWHEWSACDEDVAALNATWSAERFAIPFIGGLHYRATVTPTGYGLRLRFTAKNIGEQSLSHVTVFPCLGHPSNEAWRDAALTRTFIQTAGGIAAVGGVDRGSGDACRAHFVVRDRQPMAWTPEPFWGSASADQAASGGIVRTRDDGRFSLGMAWADAVELFHNGDEHHYIHSVPTLGDLAPGQTRSVVGHVAMVEGDAAACFAKLNELVGG